MGIGRIADHNILKLISSLFLMVYKNRALLEPSRILILNHEGTRWLDFAKRIWIRSSLSFLFCNLLRSTE